MRASRKITYAALSAAIAAVCILLAKYLPLSFVPLMVASLCFFIALRCAFSYGLITIAAVLLIVFFWGGMDTTLLLVLLLFAPYSVAAYFMRKLKYKNPQSAAIRVGVTLALINIAFALAVFVFWDFIAELFLGFKLSPTLSVQYMIAALVLSVLAVGFDITFTMADDVIVKRLRLDKK